MSQKFDAPAKELMNLGADQWARLTHLIPPDAIIIVDDSVLSLSTVTVDKFFEIHDSTGIWYLIVEFQSQANYDLPIICNYRELVVRKAKGRRARVVTVIIYSHPDALPTEQESGHYEFPRLNGETNDFNYRVIKVWERPPLEMVDGGIATAPLAPLGNISDEELPNLLRTIQERYANEEESKKDQLWGSISFLLGLKYKDDDYIAHLLRNVKNMENSSVYQRAVRQGEEREKAQSRRESLQLLLDAKFPNNPQDLKDFIQSCQNTTKLDQALIRMLEAQSWETIRDFLTSD